MDINFVMRFPYAQIPAHGVKTYVYTVSRALEERGHRVDVNGKGDYDIVHVHDIWPVFRKRGVVYTVHGTPWSHRDLFFSPVNLGYRVYLRYLYKLYPHLIVPSEYARGELESMGIRATVLHNPVDQETFRRERSLAERFEEEYGLRDFVLCVGTLSWSKGVKEFVEVSRHFDVPFVWIGPHVRVFTRKWRETRRLAREITWLGPLPHERVAWAMNAARVFLFLSHGETNPIVLGEAASVGLPSVVFDLPVYQDKDFVIKVKDVEGAKEEVRRLLGDKSYWNMWSNKALEASKTYSMERHVENLEKYYASILG